MSSPTVRVRPALPADVRAIRALVQPYADRRILLPKEWVGYYEAVQEFVVAERLDAEPVDAEPVDAEPVDAEPVDAEPVDAEPVDARPVAEGRAGRIVGCGALHVMWQDLAEIRTLAVDPGHRGHGVGHALLDALVARARELRLARVFCLTFETDFFAAHGFAEIDGTPVTPDVYGELLRSHDDGVAEFLDLARVKPNTLGNTRMLLALDRAAGPTPGPTNGERLSGQVDTGPADGVAPVESPGEPVGERPRRDGRPVA